MLDAADIEAIAVRTAELVRGAVPPTPLIMTRRQAMSYVRCTSDAAFSAFCAKWHYRAESRGRWSKPRADLAIAREAGTAHTPAGMRK